MPYTPARMSFRPELLALVTAMFLAAPAASAEGPVKAVAPAAALPTAKTADSTFAVDGDALVVTTGKTSVRLHPIAAAIFALSDGKRSIDAIRKDAEAASGYPIDEATVFAVLDALADAKLLSARVTPPGGESDLDLVVVADGTDAKDLVAPTTAKTAPGEWLKQKNAEENAKAKTVERHKIESVEKAADQTLKSAVAERKKALASLSDVRLKQESAMKAKKGNSESAEKVTAQRKVVESSAKSERSVRLKQKLKEEEKKQAVQMKQKG